MGDSQAWSRTKIMAILIAAVVFALTLFAGAIAAVVLALTPASERPAASVTESSVGESEPDGSGRDAIAAAPMLAVSPADVAAGAPSTTLADAIEIPNPTTTGAARVASGFPPTPEGAAGQLGAILVEVVQTMSVPRAHEIHEAWADPNAGPAEEWAMTQNVAEFLASAGLSGQEAGTRARVKVTPAAAQIKGTDGQDWVVVCVLLDISASIDRTADVAYGHCERMAWDGERWVIASGAAPAPAPSTWPGTDKAADAGWLTWHSETP